LGLRRLFGFGLLGESGSGGGGTGDYNLAITVVKPDISMVSVSSNGFATLTVSYNINGGPLVSPLTIGFYSSTNTTFDAGDTLLSSVTLSAAADLTSGAHTKTFTIGGGAGQVALPGAGLADSSSDYYLLAVANPSGTIAESDAGSPDPNNTKVFSGAYHAAGGLIEVHGTDNADTITVTPSGSNLVLKVNTTTTTYAAADVTGFDVRAHGGNDSVSAAGVSAPLGVWGGDGNDTLTAGLGTTTFDGGTGSNTLVGPNAINTWGITAANAGTVGGITFTNVQNLTGGTGTDTFQFVGAAAGVSGKISGGAGTNTLDYSGNGGGAIAVNLAAGTATSTGGITGITKLVGSSAATNTLTGPNATNTWSISGANAGTVGTFAFSAIQNLTGGTSTDTFKLVGAAAGVSGKISGGAGTNTLDYSGNGGGAVSVNLATGAATSTGGISGITWLVGSTAAGNTLTGPNATNAWSVTAANAGKVNAVSYSKFSKLVGGTGVDVFKFSNLGTEASVAGGGAPVHQGDWLDYSSDTIAVTVNLATGAATNVNGGAAGSVTGIQDVHGGNTLTGSAAGNILIGGTGTNTIHGGTGRSLLIADAGASTITGGSAGGGDILIAGTTTYDTMTAAHEASLMSILAEWQSADSPTTRFNDINTGTGGGLNGTNKLHWGTTVADTVKDNGRANTLTAPPGAVAVDLFFANEAVGHTRVFNRKAGDHTNNT
jgi:hypothetical protein